MQRHTRNVLPVHAATAPREFRRILGSKRPLLGIALFVLAVASVLCPSRTASPTRRLEASRSARPVIHTFFTRRTDAAGGKAEHERLIEAWRALWTEAGWEPRVIALADAERHPDYRRYADALNGIGNAHEGSYDFMCFMRWLAMSALKTGGWMSDYDTIPLDITIRHGLDLPNGGRFTSHQRHVPALVSGSASEWDRMAREVMEMAVNKTSEEFYSDMWALKDLRDKPYEVYMEELAVVSLPYEAAGVLDCKSTETALAAHLSHASVHRAFEAGYVASRDRPALAYELARDWREQCGDRRPVAAADNSKLTRNETTDDH